MHTEELELAPMDGPQLSIVEEVDPGSAPRPAGLEVADEVVDAAGKTVAQPTMSREVALANMQTAALAELNSIDAGIAALKKQHGATDYEITTPKGLKIATERRHAIRQVRYRVPHIVKATKADLKDLGKKVEVEGERVVAALLAIEKPHDDAIAAEEARKEEIAAKEAARVKVYEDTITTIRSYVLAAAGRSSAEIQSAISKLAPMSIDPEQWADYTEKGVAAKAETLAELERLRDVAKAAEDEAAENERIRLENIRREKALQLVTDLQKLTVQAMGKTSVEIGALIADIETGETAAEDASPEVKAAHTNTLMMLGMLKTQVQQKEETQAQLAALAAPPAAAPSPTAAPVLAQSTAISDETDADRNACIDEGRDRPSEVYPVFLVDLAAESAKAAAPNPFAGPAGSPPMFAEALAKSEPRTVIGAGVSFLPTDPIDAAAVRADFGVATIKASTPALNLVPADTRLVTTGDIGDLLGFAVTVPFLQERGLIKQIAPKGKTGAYWRASDMPRLAEALKSHIDARVAKFVKQAA